MKEKILFGEKICSRTNEMIEQLSLLIEDNDPVAKILKAATSSFAGAEVRWQQRRKTGLSDKALMDAIAYEFGTMGGGTLDGVHYQFQGGKPPSLTYYYLSSGDSTREKRLARQTLLDKIRVMYSVPWVES